MPARSLISWRGVPAEAFGLRATRGALFARARGSPERGRYRSEKVPGSTFAARHYYRKVALFDRLLAFDVKMDFAESARH